jgi:hypothetical protein
MLLNPNHPVSQFFLLTFLLNGTWGPWVPDEFESSFVADSEGKGYEAIIGTADNGRVPVELRYVPLPLLSFAKSNDSLVIGWKASYTNFVLQSSTSAVHLAWKIVPTQPAIVGASNMVTMQMSEPKLFFRLQRP